MISSDEDFNARWCLLYSVFDDVVVVFESPKHIGVPLRAWERAMQDYPFDVISKLTLHL
jgi:hypothetical protein